MSRSRVELPAAILGVAIAAVIAIEPAHAQARTNAVASSLPDSVHSLRIGVAGSTMRVDGRLTEAEWTAADSIDGLTEVEPRQGGIPAGRTVVRVLASGDALYIGVRADDPDAAGMVSFSRERDAALRYEDHIKVVLDTYRDGRSGYVFAVNPNGARYDALVVNRGESEDSNWDGIWQAATERTATGWTLEIRIPMLSLLFRQGLTTWGLNVERRVQRRQETSRWTSATPNFKPTYTSRAGLLTGIPLFRLGVGLSVRPSATGSLGYPDVARPALHDQDLSLDVTQRVGANSLGSVTLNTDFAETEVDTRRTNLTRFPLFFPEKRTFFLEGSDIFEFGLGLSEVIRPFFSRRIGLIDSLAAPLRAGTKLSGRIGGTSFGAIVAHTGAVDSFAQASTMGVVRIKQNVFRESTLGFVATAGDPKGRGGAWTTGLDFTYQTSHLWGSKNFLVGVWGVATGRDSMGTRQAAGISVDYPNDLWDIFASYRRLGRGFDPSLGFVPRAGVAMYSLGVNYQPRPRWLPGVRQMFHESQGTLITDLAGEWESYRVFLAPVNWRLESGDRFEVNVVPTGERLLEPFDVAEGVTIDPGTFHFNRYRAELQTAEKRTFSGQYTWWFGDWYDGTLDQLEATAKWKPSPFFIVELTGERNIGRLPAGNFIQNLIGTRFRFNVSPDLQFNSFVQYDNESESFGTNSRVRWAFSPLGDLFVVYNHNMSTLGDRFAFTSNQLLVKVQYTFRY